MGRLILLTSLFVATFVFATTPQEQAKRDLLRQDLFDKIMGADTLTVNSSNEVRYIKHMLSKSNRLDEQVYGDEPLIPVIQLFTGSTIKVGQLIKLVGLASQYDVQFHHQVNLNQKIQINTAPNSMEDIADFLDYFTESTVVLYPESKLIVVLPDPDTLDSYKLSAHATEATK